MIFFWGGLHVFGYEGSINNRMELICGAIYSREI